MLRNTKSRFLSGKSTIIFNAVLIIMLFFFGACEPIPTSIEKLVINNESVFRDAFSHEIPDTAARTYMGKYEFYISGVDTILSNGHPVAFPDPGRKLVYGAKVDRNELYEILHASDPGDPLYVMLSIMPSDSTELIFAIDSDSLGRRAKSLDLQSNSSSNWHFFDFTYPCPTSCPEY